jgi:uncharacterized membrane protein (UPF0182 family)
MSEKLTLWGQKGSEVIRGNLLVIPIENALLYVEPLYLQAQLGKMPQIKKIILCRGVEGKVVWDDSFYGALEKMVLSPIDQLDEQKIGQEEFPKSMDMKALVRSVTDHFQRYLQLTGEGKLNQAGEALEALKKDLEALNERLETK